MKDDRRRLLTATALLGLGQMILPAGGARGEEKKEEVSAAEDLMREHQFENEEDRGQRGYCTPVTT